MRKTRNAGGALSEYRLLYGYYAKKIPFFLGMGLEFHLWAGDKIFLIQTYYPTRDFQNSIGSSGRRAPDLRGGGLCRPGVAH